MWAMNSEIASMSIAQGMKINKRASPLAAFAGFGFGGHGVGIR